MKKRFGAGYNRRVKILNVEVKNRSPGRLPTDNKTVRLLKMNEWQYFIVELGICLTSSALVIAFFARVLKNVLADICGTEVRAAFWSMFTNIMLVVVPLLSMTFFGKSGVMAETGTTGLVFFKYALASSLAGIFIALSFVGFQIFKDVSQEECDKLK
ncbi:MAG: hypothetical protein GY862_11090 [Gammaproteobacteria bacterium]|nr:hypothetical protein [Gammaproteobacteria bacterium]